MDLDVSSMVASLRRAALDDNAQNGLDSQYVADIEEAVSIYVNPSLGTDVALSSVAYDDSDALTGGDFSGGTTLVDATLYSIIQSRAEMILLDRKIAKDVEVALTMDSAAGRINTKDRGRLRNELSRDRAERNYRELLSVYLYGIPNNQSLGLEMTEITDVRSVPED